MDDRLIQVYAGLTPAEPGTRHAADDPLPEHTDEEVIEEARAERAAVPLSPDEEWQQTYEWNRSGQSGPDGPARAAEMLRERRFAGFVDEVRAAPDKFSDLLTEHRAAKAERERREKFNDGRPVKRLPEELPGWLVADIEAAQSVIASEPRGEIGDLALWLRDRTRDAALAAVERLERLEASINDYGKD